VLDAADVPTGTRVMLEGVPSGEPPSGVPPTEINVNTFFSIPLRVADHIVTAGGKALTLGGKPVKTSVIADAEVH